MSSETTIVAEQYRLQEWAAQIRDCQNRPAGMSVADWCAQNGLTKANYYYRLRRVRSACLNSLPHEMLPQQIAAVEPKLLLASGEKDSSSPSPGLDIFFREFTIRVTESTPLPLLGDVLRALEHAE